MRFLRHIFGGRGVLVLIGLGLVLTVPNVAKLIEITPLAGPAEVASPAVVLSRQAQPTNGSLREPKWFFAGYRLEQVEKLFRSCGLTAAETALALEGAEWDVVIPAFIQKQSSVPFRELETPGVRVYPPADWVLKLDPAVRRRINSALATNEQHSSVLSSSTTVSADCGTPGS